MINFRAITEENFDTIIRMKRPENKIAEHVYTKIGFKPTGEISNDEIVLRMDL